MTRDPWPDPAPWPALDDALHLWRGSLELSPEAQARCEASLSPDERARADRYHFPRDRRAFVAARGTLRAVLGRTLGLPPGQVALKTDPHGKPHLVGPATLHFNLSHAGDRVLVALHRTRAVGVDLEPLRPLPDLAAMAPMVMAPDELSALTDGPDADRLDAFYAAWTRKEALVKAIGTGLAFGLPRLAVSCERGEVATVVAIDGRPTDAWSLIDVSFVGHRAAVAIAGPAPRLARWSFTP